MNQENSSYPGVMISSTFKDLKEHRKALNLALQQQDLHPVGMETHITGTEMSTLLR